MWVFSPKRFVLLGVITHFQFIDVTIHPYGIMIVFT